MWAIYLALVGMVGFVVWQHKQPKVVTPMLLAFMLACFAVLLGGAALIYKALT